MRVVVIEAAPGLDPESATGQVFTKKSTWPFGYTGSQLRIVVLDRQHDVTLHHLRRALGSTRWITFDRNIYRFERTPRPGRALDLDVDAVLLGELAFAPFDRIEVMGVDLPHALVTMGIILALNAGLIALFYKELKLSTFDAGLAATLGFAPGLLHYGLMAMVSVTAVGAFDAVGAVLVVALMVTPAAAAYLLTDDLRKMLVLSVLIAVASALGGYWLARGLNANIAGAMATVTGLIFLVVFLLAPRRGIAAVAARRQRQKLEFAQAMLAIHLLHHEGRPEADAENRAEHLSQHVHWAPAFAEKVVRYAERKGIVNNDGGLLQLTESGRLVAQEAMVR